MAYDTFPDLVLVDIKELLWSLESLLIQMFIFIFFMLLRNSPLIMRDHDGYGYDKGIKTVHEGG